MKMYKLDWSRIVYFDECLTDVYFNTIGSEKPEVENRFEFTPMTNLDTTILLTEVAKFNR